MRKITLMFMSMFLMLGTLAAQENGGETAFELLSVNPNSETPVTTVYNIRFEFSKDVTVTLPEGGIDVTNNDTKEVVKITRVYEDEWTPKNNVVLMFEQKVVPGKDGKEDELQDQYLETAGNYSYTIPAGCIKSVDGEAFEGGEFKFSIVGTFPIESYSPMQTDTLRSIVLTFSNEITGVNMPEYGLSVVDNYWMPVAAVKKDVTISEDKKSVTLELDTPIATPGQYNLDIYQGIFVSSAGISAYATLFLEVVDYNPSFSTNYETGDQVEQLGNLEITFNNVKEVKLVEGAEPVAAYLPGGGEAIGTSTLADNKITVTFDQKFVEQGEYLFVIPAGMFTMDGVANEAREIIVELFTFEVTPLEVVSVTPEVDTVNEISKIVVAFNQPIQLAMDENWQQISREIELTSGDTKYILTYAPDYNSNVSSQVEYLVNANWNGFEYESTPITTAGTYSINLADIVVNYAGENYVDEWGYPATKWHATGSVEGVCTWTVVEDGEGIDVVAPEAGEQVIYDLLGRRIEKITGAGIYIVNGKKVVVK